MNRKSDSSGEHRAVEKAGHDHIQDSKIRELHDDFRAHIKDEEHHHGSVEASIKDVDRRNSDEHSVIVARIHDAETRFGQWLERVEGKLNAHRMAAVVAWVVIAAMGGLLMSAHLTRLEDVADTTEQMMRSVQSIDKRQESWEAHATQWGKQLDDKDAEIEQRHQHDVHELEQEIKDLRRKERQGE